MTDPRTSIVKGRDNTYYEGNYDLSNLMMQQLLPKHIIHDDDIDGNDVGYNDTNDTGDGHTDYILLKIIKGPRF